MPQRTACPKCGERNYDSSPVCWACGAPLIGPRAVSPDTGTGAAQAETLLEAAPEAIEPPDVVEPPYAVETQPAPAPPSPAPPVQPEIAQVETLLEAAPEVAETGDGGETPTGAPAPAPSGPKPAELEAQALREKEYVTPPVETEERPLSVGEWFLYLTQALSASVSGFREALDEYDRRRGHKSGSMSSYGCLITAVTVALCIALIVWIVSLLAGNPI